MQDAKMTQKIAICTPSLFLRNYGMYPQLKKNVKQQYIFQMSPQYGEFRPTNG